MLSFRGQKSHKGSHIEQSYRIQKRGLDGITDSMDMSLSKQTPGRSEGQGSLVCSAVHRVAKSGTGLSDWTNGRKLNAKQAKEFIGREKNGLQ